MVRVADTSGKTEVSYAHPLFWAPYTIIGEEANVCFWHLADIDRVLLCPLLGVERTSFPNVRMSAFDP